MYMHLYEFLQQIIAMSFLVTIITVFNVIQEVIGSLIFGYMSFTSSSSVISKTLERNELCMCSKYGFGIIISEGIIDYALILCYL